MVLLVDMYILSQGLVMTLGWPCTYLAVQTWACDSPASASPIAGIPSLCHQTLLNWELGWTSVYSYRMACCVFCMVSGELYWKSSDILTKVLQQLCFLLKLTFLEFRGENPVNSTPILRPQRHTTHYANLENRRCFLSCVFRGGFHLFLAKSCKVHKACVRLSVFVKPVCRMEVFPGSPLCQCWPWGCHALTAWPTGLSSLAVNSFSLSRWHCSTSALDSKAYCTST